MIRLAIVGDSEFAQAYVDIADRIPDSTVAIIAGGDASQADAIGGTHVADTDRLLEEHSSDFDAVILGEPEPVNAIKRAAGRGKHVLVPGTPASLMSDFDAAATACSNADICLMWGDSVRYRPTLQSIRASIASGKLGAPGLLRIHRWEATTSDKGSLFGKLTREIDLACWLFDAQPNLIFAAGRGTNDDSREFDYAQLHLGFPEDGMALIDFSRRLPDGDDYFSLSVIGSTGAAYADDHHNMQLVYGGGSPSARQTTEGRIARQNQLKKFVSAINEKRTPSVSPSDARTALKIAEAARESVESGEAVRLAF